ncbi:MarR family winged helix-turn-helix transcriptional regulator [Sphingobium lignivorans]|uniref:MarR family transcriptional regulator for hemolysin n=1 Tax=Sphingobium lignivorans TaxID=2735886 RepID=A0ABR6NAR8_9SPHN|nr:MarR family transcriptional regulator [Sphingobium lignivorans]MBB5984376.1 MarR family transcriptional regulator for hemolysin [Sphingobium lignivorans]
MAADGGMKKTDSEARATISDFDDWACFYNDFYPVGERLDREYRLSRLLVMAGRSWVTHIDNRLRAETGQSRARWQALFTIAFGPQPVTLTDLGQRLLVQWPTLVRVVEGLAADGLIERRDNPRDGRSKLVTLTPAGLAVVHKIQPILDSERRAMLADLSDRELEQCAQTLRQIFARVART